MLFVSSAFAPTFHFKLCSFWWWGRKNIFCIWAQVPLLRHWSRYEFHYYVIMTLLRHRQIEFTEGRRKSINHVTLTGLTEIVLRRRRSILFSMLIWQLKSKTEKVFESKGKAIAINHTDWLQLAIIWADCFPIMICRFVYYCVLLLFFMVSWNKNEWRKSPFVVSWSRYIDK